MEDFEHIGGDSASQQYELLPGLFAVILSDDGIFTKNEIYRYEGRRDNGKNKIYVHASEIGLTRGSKFSGSNIPCESLLVAHDVTLRATMVSSIESGATMLRDLDVTIDGGVKINTWADRELLMDFLREFAGPGWNENEDSDRVNKHRTEVSEDQSENDDVLVPSAIVQTFTLVIDNNHAPIIFPPCEGTLTCTLRVLFSYYCCAILRTMHGKSDEIVTSSKDVVADMVSVPTSILGATAGSVLLGPLGFLAGSYMGGKFGRKHSEAIITGTAGACLFGPVGFYAGVAGANYAQGNREARRQDIAASSSTAEFGTSDSDKEPLSVRESVNEHISEKKYEYAGSSGVVVGAAAGAIAGPLGALAGAYVGSVSARQGTKTVSDAAAKLKQSEGRSDYEFGDFTRGLVARGKKSRGANQQEGYRFGDFTRGIFAKK